MQVANKKTFGRALPQANRSAEPVVIHDRRQHSRSHVLQSGKLAFGAPDFAIDCMIHDLSSGGARVRVPSTQAVPENVILVHLRDRIAFEASIAWRKQDGTLGLKFLARHELEQAVAPGLRALRRHCIEYSLR